MLQCLRYDSTHPIPPHFEAQIRVLLSSQWPGGEDERDQPLLEAARSPAYFVLTDGGQVLSYARTMREAVLHDEQRFEFYGLGDVITHPAFRRQGYGGRVVAAATESIRSDPTADGAILLTDESLVSFYCRSGWEVVRGARVTTDESEDAGLLLMLFLSEKAQAARRAFAHTRLVLPSDEW